MHSSHRGLSSGRVNPCAQSGHKVKGSRSFQFDVIPQQRQDIGMVSAPATFYLPGSP